LEIPPPSRGFYQKGFHPMTTDTMPADVIEYLTELVQEDRDRKLGHLRWLDANPGEEDRDQQIVATEAALALATRAASFFPAGD
jgi:hypothetical protein